MFRNFLMILILFFSPICLADSSSWSAYLDQTKDDTGPSKPLVLALKLLKQEDIQTGHAVDLGAGSGKDTLYLLRNHWQVLALDYSPKAISIILERAKQAKLSSPATQISDFNTMQLPDNIDLINANLSLPFTNPEDFDAVWENVESHIRVGGQFSGNFFGTKDQFSNIDNQQMTFITKQKLLEMFKDFKIESLTSREGNYSQANGKIKYWQIWDVVAKKIK
jgi:tellurite methyltransferase